MRPSPFLFVYSGVCLFAGAARAAARVARAGAFLQEETAEVEAFNQKDEPGSKVGQLIIVARLYSTGTSSFISGEIAGVGESTLVIFTLDHFLEFAG